MLQCPAYSIRYLRIMALCKVMTLQDSTTETAKPIASSSR